MTPRSITVRISLFFILFLVNGCMETGDYLDEGSFEENEQEIGNTWDIGIIPASTSCPYGGALREIHMDDEDNNNKSKVFGWVGATESSHNTTFRFCRVDGSNFFPLAWASPSNVSAYYAVLKMGSECPNGSFEFSRYFDNEDKNNSNWANGDIEPSWVRANTHMVFCLFRGAGPGYAMSAFPDLGIEYGVFADLESESTFPLAIDVGYVYTDDEDRNNANYHRANIDWSRDAQRIISGASNTQLDMVRVH